MVTGKLLSLAKLYYSLQSQCIAVILETDLSRLEVLRNSLTVIGFFWMLYCVNKPDWPVTTCWMGAGITRSSMSSYVRRGFQPLGGTTWWIRQGLSVFHSEIHMMRTQQRPLAAAQIKFVFSRHSSSRQRQRLHSRRRNTQLLMLRELNDTFYKYQEIFKIAEAVEI